MSYNDREYKPTHLTGSTTYQVFTGKGILANIIVNNTTATALSVYDGVGVTTTPIAILKSSIVENTYIFNCTIANGLYIVGGTAGDYTVTWTK